MNNHTDLVNAALDYFKIVQFFAWKNNSGAIKTERRFVRFGYPGSPDILMIHKGIFFGIEAKTGTGRQSPEQKAFQANLEKSGGKYIIIRSLDDVITLVKAIK